MDFELPNIYIDSDAFLGIIAARFPRLESPSNLLGIEVESWQL